MLSPQRHLSFVALTIAFFASACSGAPATLREAAAGRFHMGVAIGPAIFSAQGGAELALLEREFDSVTPDNCMKWANIHPEAERYEFTLADRFVAFAQERRMHIVGHTLMWHQQTPRWVFRDASGALRSRESLLAELRQHISTVVGRYKGRVKGWDVVNEAVDDKGGLRLDRPWYQILGEEGIFAAFEAAHAADPDAELYYNDYSVWNEAKLKSVLDLVAKLRARGLRIDAVGLQEHYLAESPTTDEIDAMLAAFERIGMPVMVTELDVSMLPRPDGYDGAEISKQYEQRAEFDPYRSGLPPEAEQRLASRYAGIFSVYARHASNIRRVTFWGLHDGVSWLNHWPIRGRRDYPLLFDRQLNPKPAHGAVLRALAPAAARP